MRTLPMAFLGLFFISLFSNQFPIHDHDDWWWSMMRKKGMGLIDMKFFIGTSHILATIYYRNSNGGLWNVKNEIDWIGHFCFLHLLDCIYINISNPHSLLFVVDYPWHLFEWLFAHLCFSRFSELSWLFWH